MTEPPFVVRPFRRADRDHLTELVNAHVAAVLPGASVSVNTVLSHLERRPGEFIVDPWVTDRVTLVAEQAGRVAAAVHLLRYHDGTEVADTYRGAGEIAWLLFWPSAPAENPHWSDGATAARGLMDAAVRILGEWRVGSVLADCTLPAPACYGVPEQWPHVRNVFERAGFRPDRTETVLVATVADLPHRPDPALDVRRTVGMSGTRLSLGDDGFGYIEIDTNLHGHERLARRDGWADIGNFAVPSPDPEDRTAIALLTATRDWLTLAGTRRLLAYAESAAEADSLRRLGFGDLTTTLCGWSRTRSPRQP